MISRYVTRFSRMWNPSDVMQPQINLSDWKGFTFILLTYILVIVLFASIALLGMQHSCIHKETSTVCSYMRACSLHIKARKGAGSDTYRHENR